MTSDAATIVPSRTAKWAGWVVSAIPVLMMGVGGLVMMFAFPQVQADGMKKYGFPASAGWPLLAVEIVSVILYAIPRTAVLGAILLTGYLGGAVATHVRAAEPFWLPVLFGVLVWLGLWLRDLRVRALAPLRSER